MLSMRACGIASSALTHHAQQGVAKLDLHQMIVTIIHAGQCQSGFALHAKVSSTAVENAAQSLLNLHHAMLTMKESGIARRVSTHHVQQAAVRLDRATRVQGTCDGT